MFTLTAEYTPGGDDAVVRYRGVNGFRTPLFVCHLPLDAGFGRHPHTAYAALSADDLRLNLLLGESPLPVDEDVEYSVRPLAVRVSPGGEVRGEVRLQLPALEWNAYFLPTAEGTSPDPLPAYQIALAVDVCPVVAGQFNPVDSPPDHFSVFGPMTRHTVVLTPDRPVPVWKRVEPFARW